MLRYIANRIVLGGVVLTLAVGFVPILFFTLGSNSFGPRSRVTVPMSLVPSVLVGDSLLLPFFNGTAALAIVSGTVIPAVRRRVLGWLLAITALAIGGLMNIWLHKMWMKNGQTGFISIVPGQLSLGGKWHLVYASLQMGFVLWFAVVSLLAARGSDRRLSRNVLTAWRIFIAYSTLAIGDFFLWHLFVARTFRLIITDLFAFMPFFLALAFYWRLSMVSNIDNKLRLRPARV